MSKLSLNTLVYEIITIDNKNYYLLDKLKIILNGDNEIVGFYNYEYSIMCKTEEENTKYILDNRDKFFFYKI